MSKEISDPRIVVLEYFLTKSSINRRSDKCFIHNSLVDSLADAKCALCGDHIRRYLGHMNTIYESMS